MGTVHSRLESEEQELNRKADRAIQRAKILELKHPELTEAIARMRIKYSIDAGGFKEADLTLSWWKNVHPKVVNEWNTGIKGLQKILHLGQYDSWYLALQTYTLTGFFSAPLLSVKVRVDENGRSLIPADEFTDLKEASYLETFLMSDRQFSGQHRQTKKVDVDLQAKIIQLGNRGLSDAQIADTINNFLPQGSTIYSSTDVADKRSKFKKRMSLE